MPTLARVNVTPVKGLALQHPTMARITADGLPENRRFFLVDESGRLFSGSTLGALVRIRPEYEPLTESLTVTFPDSTVVTGDVGTLGASELTDYYGRSVPARIVEGPWGEAFSAYAGRPVRMLRCDRDGDGVDVFPLTLISWASVRDLAVKGKHQGELDSRRFRINLELDGCEPYDEDSWHGRTVSIGEAELTLHGPIPRCVVVTQDPDTGSKDWDTLTQIARYRPRIPGDGGLPFGMYATVARPGDLHVGDPVQVD